MRALIKWLEDVRGGETPQFDLLNGESITSVVSKSLLLALDKLDREQGADMADWRRAAAPMEWTPFNFRGIPQADSNSVLSLPGYQNRGSENNFFVATGEGIEARDVIPGGQGFLVGRGDTGCPPAYQAHILMTSLTSTSNSNTNPCHLSERT